MGKRPPPTSPSKPKKKGRKRNEEEEGVVEAETAAQMRRRMILERNDDDDEELIADIQEEGGYMLEDIYIPPKIARSEHPGTGQRLVIEKIVCENFKSYGGLKEMGPVHKSFSAIIGPNGNGKSNIIDAMLFVFGYRASKIRCKKVSTLIHKSELLPNVRSCAVTVHFVKIIDEGDKGKGDDYEIVEGSGITVKRRAFSDNSSVYHLDGRKVKFQDVAKFLKINGIDIVHNRFLILQGEVEQIAQMPPISPNGHDTGLLEFLEEVIGTKRYIKPLALLDERIEKYDYEREEKLQRVDLAEKEKENLKEPVQKAKDYLRDRNSLTKYQSLKYQKVAHVARLKCEEKLKGLTELQDRMDVLQKRLNEISEINQARKHEYQEVEKHFKAAEREYNKAKKALDVADAQYIQLNEELKRTNDSRKKNQKDAVKLEAEVEKLKGLPESHAADIEKLNTRKAELDEEVEQEGNNVKGDLAKLNIKVEAALKEKEAADKEFSKLKRQLDEKKSALEKLQKELNNYKDKETVEQNKLAQMEADLEKLKQTVQQKEKEGRSSLGHNNLAPMEENLAQLQDTVQQLAGVENQKKNVFEQRRGEFLQAKDAMEGSSDIGHVDRLLMEAKAEGMFQGLYGRLKNLATIPEKYNVAATMATSMLEYWVADNEKTSGEIINFLRTKGLPVQSFMCLNKLGMAGQMRERFVAPDQSHRIFDLLNITEPDVAPAFFKAFRNTLVAENIDIATKVSYGGTRRFRVVTLLGEIVETTGSMVGGGNQRLEGKFNSKTAKITVTKQQLTNLQNKCEAAQKEFNKVQQERQSVEVKVRELTEKIQEFKRKLTNFNSDLAALKAQLPLKQANLEEQKKRTKEAAISPKVLKEKEALVQKANEDYEGLLEPCQEAEEAAANVAEKVNELQVNKKKKITEKLDKLTDMRKKVVEETNKKRVELKNCETNRIKAEKKLGTTRNEIEKAEKMMVKLAEKKKSLEESGKEIKVQEQELLAKMEEAKQAYEERKGQSNEFQQEQSKLSKDRAQLENKLSDAKAEINRLDHQRSSAVEMIKNLEVKEIPDEAIEPLKELTVEELNQLAMDELDKKIKKYSEKLKRDAPNLNILDEYKAKVDNLFQRIHELDEITKQRDLFRETYCRLDQQRATEFMEGFALISSRLKEMFRMISMGGDAELEVVDILDLFGCGVQFSVRPARKTWKKISNLSGGEKTLASLSLVFALHHFKPSPFYVMDEIDAALDFKNVSIIANYIKDRTKFTQFIIISLRSNMFELADSLLGVYKVDNMSYCIHICVKRLINELKAKYEASGKDGPPPDNEAFANLAATQGLAQAKSIAVGTVTVENEEDSEPAAKKPRGFPDINVSAISNGVGGGVDEDVNIADVEDVIPQSPDTVIEKSGNANSQDGSTVLDADNTKRKSSMGLPLPEVSAIIDDAEAVIEMAGSEELFEEMEVDDYESNRSAFEGPAGPLAASTPFVAARRPGSSGGLLRQSNNRCASVQEEQGMGEVSQDSSQDQSEVTTDQSVSTVASEGTVVESPDSSFKTAESSQQTDDEDDSGDVIGPSQ